MSYPKKRIVNHFMMVEVVMAMGLLLILTACLFASLRTLHQMDRSFSNERRGLLVVDNTLERLEHKQHYTAEQVRRIFIDEFNRSGLANSKMTTRTSCQGANLKLAVVKSNKKPLIEVQVKCQP